ncbi:D-aminoacyl-tRNA deacylase 1-like isoform X2 [Watersipora subatra]|uniref:D-aminoacyl-tRNA deacylase 1-like isoform X2 n=1 Tax=Watersipora subatra TaxID=2589382 RepID=UPI00355C56F3
MKDGNSHDCSRVRKILNLRVFDEDGKGWDKNVMDKNLEVLCVSQFTLCYILKGNKPDFHQAMAAEQSQLLYNSFLEQMRDAYCSDRVKDGRFQAYMQVHIQNDGPITIPLESPVVVQDEKQAIKAAKAAAWQPKPKTKPVEDS